MNARAIVPEVQRREAARGGHSGGRDEGIEGFDPSLSPT